MLSCRTVYTVTAFSQRFCACVDGLKTLEASESLNQVLSGCRPVPPTQQKTKMSEKKKETPRSKRSAAQRTTTNNFSIELHLILKIKPNKNRDLDLSLQYAMCYEPTGQN